MSTKDRIAKGTVPASLMSGLDKIHVSEEEVGHLIDEKCESCGVNVVLESRLTAIDPMMAYLNLCLHIPCRHSHHQS